MVWCHDLIGVKGTRKMSNELKILGIAGSLRKGMKT
jgi:hypothetical protein